MIQIPTFEVGERVIWHRRPYEWVCPNCGAMATASRGDFLAIVTNPITTKPMLTELCCNVLLPPQEGFVEILCPGEEDWTIAVPYPLLEKIEQ